MRFSRPLWRGKSYLLTMLTGQLVENGPVLPLLIAPMWLTQFRSEASEHPVLFLPMLPFGFVLVWCGLLVNVSAWRWWALRYRDMSPEEVQWRGESAQLLWPERSRAARTALYMWRAPKRRRSR